MAAENAEEDAVVRGRVRCFNEAAAHGRGKPLQRRRQAQHLARASMRPRRMAAENARHDRRGDRGADAASMRPRRMAAENLPCVA